MEVKEHFSLKALNTFGIDAKARYFAECLGVEELKSVLADPRFTDVPRMILGGGSNLLFTRDYPGLVIHNALKGIQLISENDDHVYVKAAAGEVWHEFVMYCIDHGHAGIENLSLIPGNVGAGPMQNIGAYGVEIKDVFHELEALNIADRLIRTFNATDCKFGYRESVFKREVKDQYIITSVTFRLNKKPKFNTSYGAIETELKNMNVTEKSIKVISQAVINIRSSKLPDPKVIGNAGSFFKNPEVVRSKFEFLKVKYPDIVGFELENGNMKLAAGWLIERCGWKGKTFGDAGVHKLQALVLVNYGNASGEEIMALSQKVLDSVKNTFGIELEREVNII